MKQAFTMLSDTHNGPAILGPIQCAVCWLVVSVDQKDLGSAEAAEDSKTSCLQNHIKVERDKTIKYILKSHQYVPV